MNYLKLTRQETGLLVCRSTVQKVRLTSYKKSTLHPLASTPKLNLLILGVISFLLREEEVLAGHMTTSARYIKR